ncbi:MAG: hypothetical protein KDD82_30925 [Planctomycetes bacterium]|nr:hypothetical protein [Planctomycetota bacterium]
MDSRVGALLLSLVLGCLGSAQAEEDYFPLTVGTTWDYELTIKRGEKSHSIRYSTEAVRKEALDGVECVVFETRSGSKLLSTSWYAREGSVVREWQSSTQGGALVQKLREVVAEEEGAEEPEPERGRVLLDAAKREPGTSWAWSSAEGDASGTVTVLGTTELTTPALGKLTCLQIEERGEFRRGDKTAQQVRTLWFAPQLGLVREVSKITLPSGGETTSEAMLLARPKAETQ